MGGGSKQLTSLYINNNGTRKSISALYGNINGTSKKIFPALVYTWKRYIKKVSKKGLSESLGSGSFTNYFGTLYYASNYSLSSSTYVYNISCNDNNVRIDSEVKHTSGAATAHYTVTAYSGYLFLYEDPFSARSQYQPCPIKEYQCNRSDTAPSYIYLFEINSFESIIGDSDIKCNYSDSYQLDVQNTSDGYRWEYDTTLTSTNRNAYSEGEYGNYKYEYIGAN